MFASTGALAASPNSPQFASVEFNDLFLHRPGAERVDVRRFEKGNVAAPGSYRADLVVNSNWIGRAQITLQQVPGSADNVQPCFDRELLMQVGVDVMKLSPEATQVLTGENATCATLDALIPDAFATFDNGWISASPRSR